MTKLWSYFLLLLFFPAIGFSKVDFDGLKYHFRMNYPKAEQVILLFSFDNYATQYHMGKDDLNPGDFNLTLDTTKIGSNIKSGKYYYRVIVDDVMTYDSSNPLQEIMPYIGILSYFEVKNVYMDNLDGPVRIAPLTYRFFYHQGKEKPTPNQVLLTNNIDSWSLYNHILKPSLENPRIWYVDIRFDYPGKIEYTYIVDGNWVPDYNNENAIRNSAGQDISVLDVK